MYKRQKRNVEKVNYKESSEDEYSESTSKWSNKDIERFNIKIVDVTTFPTVENIARELELEQWKDEKWLLNCDLDELDISDKAKTLIDKIIEVFKFKYLEKLITECYVDGYMNTLIDLLKLDNYPCLSYPGFPLTAELGDDKEKINTKLDFAIINSKTNKSIIIVIEDKTTRNAIYQNNWKEAQVIGEIFVALHSENGYKTVYAIRVVASMFTFYKCTITETYRKANLRKEIITEELIVERYPPVGNNEHLEALDFYNYNDRVEILRHLSYIHNEIKNIK